MDRLKTLARKVTGERGITGLETAIVLIAFVVVAAVFAFVVLSTGLFSSERGKETVYAGLEKTRGSMELSGGVIATSDGTNVTDLTMSFTLAAGGDSVNLDASDATNTTVISYIDGAVTDNDLTYTTTEVVGDGDKLLEPGELAQVSIDLATECATCLIGANETFTLEVKPPSGSYVVIQRTMPSSMSDTIINLN
ncbi:MAG TPA: archaellin/type IV pilin N-terminal domain-containing protein [Dehalococcoidia bacterium]|nr:archaellin/type IV pilin N-terminal domain-containing protein [Dehalococcoidia bacterium]